MSPWKNANRDGDGGLFPPHAPEAQFPAHSPERHRRELNDGRAIDDPTGIHAADRRLPPCPQYCEFALMSGASIPPWSNEAKPLHFPPYF